MTDTNLDRAAQMAGFVPVTQEDRDAAAPFTWGAFGTHVVDGKCDDLPCPQAFAAHRIAADHAGYERGQRETVARIVAWLRKENGLCDCHARSEGECGCGAWDDYKQWPLERTADAIEAGEWE